jgi:hypothetical protein
VNTLLSLSSQDCRLEVDEFGVAHVILGMPGMGFGQADAREGFQAYQDKRSPTFKSG